MGLFFGCFSSLGHIHGNENHFQFTALHFKAMGFIKILNQRKSHECCGSMMNWLIPRVLWKHDELAIGGGTAAAMSIASECTNS
jgi:hypothetical protein